MKPYKNLGKRILNEGSGQIGTIIEATKKEGGKHWSLIVSFDNDPNPRGQWTTAEIWKYNRLVPDDFVPDYGPMKERLEAMIKALKEGLDHKRGYITHAFCGPSGKDDVSLWSPFYRFTVHANLYGNQGSWSSAEHKDKQAAIDDLLAQLEKAHAEIQ